jgi:hypothetical protein
MAAGGRRAVVALLAPASVSHAQAPIFSGASPAPDGFVAPGVWAGSEFELVQPRVPAIDVATLIDQLLGGPDAARDQLNSGAYQLTGAAVDVEIYPGFVQRLEPREVTASRDSFEIPLSLAWHGRAVVDDFTLSALCSITKLSDAQPRLVAEFNWDSWPHRMADERKRSYRVCGDAVRSERRRAELAATDHEHHCGTDEGRCRASSRDAYACGLIAPGM